ncbi:MAG: hypothetical protein JWO48_684 [Bryobacterales bacterium]|nr:hypothetical protein [Bryobacterales bacterium]
MPLRRRIDVLAQVPAFSFFSSARLEQLATSMGERHDSPGAKVVSDGDLGDLLYVIVDGSAEVSVAGFSEPVPLAALGPGELFGELALLTPESRRQATVTALTDLTSLTLAAPDFRRMLAESPELESAFARTAGELLAIKLLKTASPFAELPIQDLRLLASRLQPITAAAGETILRQGEPGSVCYLVRKGHVEVITNRADGSEQVMTTLGPGALFGEAALLIDAPRNATVRAKEAADLLALHRTDLMEVFEAHTQAFSRVMDLTQMRSRPQRVSGIIVSDRPTADAETITILKNPLRHTYYRLSGNGRFLWDRMDGRHSIRDLTLDYFEKFRQFAPQVVAQVASGLASSGFIEIGSLRTDLLRSAPALTWWQRVLFGAQRAMDWQIYIKNIDSLVTRLYNAGIHLIYTSPAQLVAAAVAILGVALFFFSSHRAGQGFQAGYSILWFLIPAEVLAIFIHECGHAFTTKAFGYEVPRAGVGWHWFTPIAFIDTSDIWLAPKWPRIAVTLAGPYSNLVLGGMFALAASLTSSPAVTAALWQFALVSYTIAVFNLNPLLEYDGYYVLMDALERPNFRLHAFVWVGKELPRSWRNARELRAHVPELLYAVLSVVYILAMAAAIVVLYRSFAYDWAARLLPSALATAVGWVLAGVVMLLSVLNVAREMSGISRQPDRAAH